MHILILTGTLKDSSVIRKCILLYVIYNKTSVFIPKKFRKIGLLRSVLWPIESIIMEISAHVSGVFLNEMFLFNLMLLLCVQTLAVSSDRPCSLTIRNVSDSCSSINVFLNDKFFKAVRKAESEGKLCRISEDNYRIGPYQISEKYYNDAVCFNEELKLNGEFSL